MAKICGHITSEKHIYCMHLAIFIFVLAGLISTLVYHYNNMNSAAGKVQGNNQAPPFFLAQLLYGSAKAFCEDVNL